MNKQMNLLTRAIIDKDWTRPGEAHLLAMKPKALDCGKDCRSRSGRDYE